jgi:hypothetical protein
MGLRFGGLELGLVALDATFISHLGLVVFWMMRFSLMRRGCVLSQAQGVQGCYLGIYEHGTTIVTTNTRSGRVVDRPNLTFAWWKFESNSSKYCISSI